MEEYEVEWGPELLGLTLGAELGDDMPPVVGKVTRTDTAAARANIQPGHLLVAVNGQDTASRSYDTTVALLQSVKRPTILRFRIPPSRTSVSSHRSSRADPSGNISQRRNSRRSTSSRDNGNRPRSSPSPGRDHTGPCNSQERRSDTSSSRSRQSRETHEEELERSTYTVLWEDGPLGMSFRAGDSNVDIPAIRKLNGKGRAQGLEHCRIGDRLLGVNGEPSKRMGFSATIDLLKSCEKPLRLTFKRPPRVRISGGGASAPTATDVEESSSSTQYAQYDILWQDKDLGIKLKPSPRDQASPVISRLTGKGSPVGIHQAHLGDELVLVNDQKITGQSYVRTLKMLKHAPKPVTLCFRYSSASRASMASRKSRRESRHNRAGVSPTSSHNSLSPARSSSTSSRGGSGSGGVRESQPRRRLTRQHSEVRASSRQQESSNAIPRVSADSVLNPHNHEEEERLREEKEQFREQELLREKKEAKARAEAKARQAKTQALAKARAEAEAEAKAKKEQRERMKEAARKKELAEKELKAIERRREKALKKETERREQVEREKEQRRLELEEKRRKEQALEEAKARMKAERDELRKQRSAERERARQVVLGNLEFDVVKSLFVMTHKIHPAKGAFEQIVIADMCELESPREAEYIRKHAKKLVLQEANAMKKSTSSSEKGAAFVALSRPEREVAILQAALDVLVDRAQVYAEKIANRDRENILNSATKSKSKQLVGQQNVMLAELATVISDLKRDSYSEFEFSAGLDQDRSSDSPRTTNLTLQQIGFMDDNDNLYHDNSNAAVSCADCGANEIEAELEMDDDGHWYCLPCWDKFMSETTGTSASTSEHAPLEQPPVQVETTFAELEDLRLSKAPDIDRTTAASLDLDLDEDDEEYWRKKKEEAALRRQAHERLKRGEEEEDDLEPAFPRRTHSRSRSTESKPRSSASSKEADDDDDEGPYSSSDEQYQNSLSEDEGREEESPINYGGYGGPTFPESPNKMEDVPAPRVSDEDPMVPLESDVGSPGPLLSEQQANLFRQLTLEPAEERASVIHQFDAIDVDEDDSSDDDSAVSELSEGEASSASPDDDSSDDGDGEAGTGDGWL